MRLQLPVCPSANRYTRIYRGRAVKSAAARTYAATVRILAHGAGIACVPSPIPVRVLTDPTRLRQILMNLAGNAIKFTESGGVTLRVSTHSQGAETIVRVAVEDTGIGMNSDQAQRLFAAFSQADTSVTRCGSLRMCFACSMARGQRFRTRRHIKFGSLAY